ncbi:MAG: caspase family protein, partial [Spirochaetota bacterium]
GIDNYPNLSEENQLNYCIKDARDLKTTLIEHGWQEGEITLLENAIRNEIITELNLIVEQAEAGDYMFVYYSGHGNRFPDTSGDETDGYDEAIIPSNYDGDTVGPILDDELGAIFSKARTQKGVFIFDSCFSGGVINKSITDPLLTSRYLNTRGTSGSSGTGDMDVASFPVMTASSQNEESYESSKLEHGIFTYTLLEAISGLNADANSDGHITIRELFDYAEDNTEYIAEYYFGVSQHPKLRFIGDFVDILVTR